MNLIGYITALLLVLGCSGDGGPDATYTANFDDLSLHWEAAEPSDDVRWSTVPASGERIALDPEVVLGIHHFAAARTTQESGTHSVELVMTPEGRSRMRDQSASNHGRRLAIVVGEEVYGLPLVVRTVDSETLNLPPMPDAVTAESVARQINEAIEAT
jgi:preprotein translocase subunit SecD